ncbi:MAG: recombination-associated protein RdgC [Syntrophobacteraceae bacterium]|nr:recombination-associated protein RdgC [Desulfobacteraceae bacterium]
MNYLGSSFTRAKLDPNPGVTNEWIQERLNSVVCRGLEDGQRATFGFIPFDKPERGNHHGMEHSKGEYTVFRFQRLRKRVPSSVLRMRIDEEIEKYRKAGTKPGKSVVYEIRELISAQLLTRAFPIPTGFPVIWNTQTGLMLLGTTSAALLDEFLTCFEKGFQGYPRLFFHSLWAIDLLSNDDRLKQRLKAQFAWENALAISEARRLGYDFLTWLWYHCESDKTILIKGKEANVKVTDKLVLVKADDRSDRVTCVTSDSMLPEAREGLRKNKLVDEARIWIGIGDDEYALTLDSSLQALKSIKLPHVIRDPEGSGLDEEGLFLERMYHIEQIQAVLDGLYGQFLSKRLLPTWERSVRDMIRELFARTEQAA